MLSPAEFSQLWERHSASLLLLARGRCAYPEDCVQEAFFRLATEAVSPNHPQAWLVRVVRNNRKLITKIPEVFRSLDSWKLGDEGKTRFQLPLTQKSLFGQPAAVKIRDILDGTSNTLLVVESPPSRAVVWTRPVDLILTQQPMQTLLAPNAKGFHACLADGSARQYPRTLPVKTLNALLSFNGGEIIGEIE